MFQREYVWSNGTSQAVACLIDSQVPRIGLLFWKTQEPPVKLKNVDKMPLGALQVHWMVSRLTTLFSMLM